MDAKDTEGKWYNSVIALVYTAGSQEEALPAALRGCAEDVFRVHFLGWHSKFDLFFRRSSKLLQPLFSQVRNWRDVKVGQAVEVRVQGKWYLAKVDEIDEVHERVRLNPAADSSRDKVQDTWEDLWR